MEVEPMKLTYRGVHYQEKNSTVVVPAESREIIYRGNSSKARINPKFPWIGYIKQLFNQSKSIIDPISFWYDHRRKFIENCWLSDDVENLDRAWDLTLQIERNKASKPKTQLKYRGVTYYR